MAPHKFVIKCGNFAVLVDLHVLPLGGREDASWFTTDHIEEVTALVRDAVDQRVKQHADSLLNRKKTKQKKELAPAAALSVKGTNFSVVANFLKRHFSLRCVTKQLYGDLRVFPERYVVCASRSEDASALHGNPSPAATELLEQSRSEYFSSAMEPLNSCTKTKQTTLQKIAKQARVQRELHGSVTGEQLIDRRARPKSQEEESRESESERQAADHEEPEQESPPDGSGPREASCQREVSQSKRSKRSDSEDDLHPQRAKRTCLGRPPAETHLDEGSEHDPLPKPESKAFPVSGRSETTLEVELLTPGKRAQRLPLTSNNTAQTNQNRPAASLRGLSVRPASSGSSISSRPTLGGGEGSENVPRTSRLRRQKRS